MLQGKTVISRFVSSAPAARKFQFCVFLQCVFAYLNIIREVF